MAKANNLWIKTAYAKVPGMNQGSQGDDAIARVKLFSVLNGWRWFITEYDTETGEAFGLVQGAETELGPFAIREVNPGDWGGEDMQTINDQFRKHRFPMPPFERDLHFTPTTLREIREKLERTGHA